MLGKASDDTLSNATLKYGNLIEIERIGGRCVL